MTISSTLKRAVCQVATLSLLVAPFAPQALAADLNYDADTNLVVNSVSLVILSGSHASRLVIGTTLTVDVPAGTNFFLVSRDGTALPNSVTVGTQAQAAINQVCTQNAQGQSTENVLSILGAVVGTTTVNISPTSGTKCQNVGGSGQSSSGGGGGGGGVSGGSAASSGTLPPAPTVIPGVTSPTAPAAPTAPTTGTGTQTPATPAPVVAPSAPVALPPTSSEISEQSNTRTGDAIDRYQSLLSEAQANAPAPVAGRTSPTPFADFTVSNATNVLTSRILPSNAPLVFAAVTRMLLDNLPSSVAAKGAGEFAGAINSSIRANNGVIPSDTQGVKDIMENASLVVNGRFPMDRFKNPTLEDKMVGYLSRLYQRDLSPGEDTTKEIADRNAVVVSTYGLRQQKRNMKAETSCERPVTTSLVRPGLIRKNSAEYWNLVNACAYSGASR